MRKILLFIILIIFGCIFAYSAPKIIVSSPKDKSITEDTKIIIKGSVIGSKTVSINGTKTNLVNGEFTAAGLLKPGKNLIKIETSGPDKSKVTKYLKLIRIVNFDDLKELFGLKDHWAKQHIIALSTLGFIEGYSDNLFRPEELVTKGEFATWLSRALELKTSVPKKDVFFDVPKEHWRAKYIDAVIKAGLMKSSSENNFGIDDKIRRIDAIKILVNGLKIKPAAPSGKLPFGDINSDTKDVSYISAAYDYGLIVGASRWRNVFNPDKDMKRGEAVAILSRVKYIKRLRLSLLDFNSGFTNKYCAVSTSPIIKKAVINPKDVINNGRRPVKLEAIVADQQGIGDISQVWVDLTELNGPFNAKMNQTGTGSFELTFAVSGEVKPGIKKVNIFVLDKSGLKSERSLKLNVTDK